MENKNKQLVDLVIEPSSKGKRGLGKKDSFLTKLVKVYERSEKPLTKRDSLVSLITEELENEEFDFKEALLLKIEVNERMRKYRTRFYAAFCKSNRANSVSGSDFYKDSHYTKVNEVEDKKNEYFIGKINDLTVN